MFYFGHTVFGCFWRLHFVQILSCWMHVFKIKNQANMCIKSHRFLCHPYGSWEFHDRIKYQCPGVTVPHGRRFWRALIYIYIYTYIYLLQQSNPPKKTFQDILPSLTDPRQCRCSASLLRQQHMVQSGRCLDPNFCWVAWLNMAIVVCVCVDMQNILCRYLDIKCCILMCVFLYAWVHWCTMRVSGSSKKW